MVVHNSLLLIDFHREVKVTLEAESLAVFLNFSDGGLDVSVVPLIDFQGFFLGIHTSLK